MRERGPTFKQAVDEAVRRASPMTPGGAAKGTPTFRLGFEPSTPWDKAPALAGRLEDDGVARRLAARR